MINYVSIQWSFLTLNLDVCLLLTYLRRVVSPIHNGLPHSTVPHCYFDDVYNVHSLKCRIKYGKKKSSLYMISVWNVIINLFFFRQRLWYESQIFCALLRYANFQSIYHWKTVIMFAVYYDGGGDFTELETPKNVADPWSRRPFGTTYFE